MDPVGGSYKQTIRGRERGVRILHFLVISSVRRRVVTGLPVDHNALRELAPAREGKRRPLV